MKRFWCFNDCYMYSYGNACSGADTLWCKGRFELVKGEFL